MAKILENLRWKPMWVSHLGCIQGCLEYLNLDVSDAWLFGATGHAFILNVHEVVCPSGPTAWRTETLFRLGKNVGYVLDGVFGFKSEGDFAQKQQLAWEHTKKAIDRGMPCYGWELDIPEFYVVYGYDDSDEDGGYLFSGPGCDEGKGPKPWRELGDTEIGVIEMYSVKAGQAAHDVKTIKEAFEFAVEHATSPEKWIFPRYRAGLAGFDNWIRATETGKADGMGMAYNAAVWNECRGFAVLFLQEARARLGNRLGSLFDEAINHYRVVAQNLGQVADTFPFHGLKPEHIQDPGRRSLALERLRAARDAEASGLDTLRRIAGELQPARI